MLSYAAHTMRQIQGRLGSRLLGSVLAAGEGVNEGMYMIGGKETGKRKEDKERDGVNEERMEWEKGWKGVSLCLRP